MIASAAITIARRLALDADPTGIYAFTDADWLEMVTDAYHSWLAAFDDSLINLTATTTGSDVPGVGVQIGAGSGVIIRKVQRVELSTGAPLRRIEPGEMAYNQGVLGTLGTPKEYSVYEITNGSQPVFYLNAFPIGAAVLTVWVNAVSSDLALGSTLELNAADARWVARIAAAEGYRILSGGDDVGRQAILAPIPQDIQSELGIMAQRRTPRVRPQEEVA